MMRTLLIVAVATSFVWTSSVQASVPIMPAYYHSPPLRPHCDAKCGLPGTTDTCHRSFRDRSLGTFTCRSAFNATLLNTQCYSNFFSTNPSGPTSLLNDFYNCGACNKGCESEVGALYYGAKCENAQCACSPQSCGGNVGGNYKNTGWCNLGTKKCEKCPAGTGHCGISFMEVGNSSDCSTNLMMNPMNCGRCGMSCYENGGDTCAAGACMCGTGIPCSGATPYCVNGACSACKTSSDCQNHRGLGQPEQYCDNSLKACNKCPAGRGDCTYLQADGLTFNTGSLLDCETDLLQSGTVDSCGSCGASTNVGNSALSCCAGTPKCGKYANNSMPTLTECAVATSCGTESYCDENLQKCLPLLIPGKLNCKGTAVTPMQTTTLDSAPRCGSCNEAASILNTVTKINNETLYKSYSCMNSDRDNCGSLGKRCKSNQACINGECACLPSGYLFWFSWDEFDSKDPEQDEYTAEFKRQDMLVPAEGCNERNPIYTIKNNFARRAAGYINSFLDCAEAAQKPTVTYEDFRSPSLRSVICNGMPGQCNPLYCDNLFQKSEKLKANGMCGSFSQFTQWFVTCAMNFKYSQQYDADPTCRYTAIEYLAQVNETSVDIGFQDAALFFQCPEVQRLQGWDTYTLPVPFNNGPSTTLRYQVTKMYGGDASSLAVSSIAIVASVILAVVYVA